MHLVVITSAHRIEGRVGDSTAAEPFGQTRTQLQALSAILSWAVGLGAETFEILR